MMVDAFRKGRSYQCTVFLCLATKVLGINLGDAGLPPPPPFISEECKVAYSTPLQTCNDSDSTDGCSSACAKGLPSEVQDFCSQCGAIFPTAVVNSFVETALTRVCVNGFLEETATAAVTPIPSSLYEPQTSLEASSGPPAGIPLPTILGVPPVAPLAPTSALGSVPSVAVSVDIPTTLPTIPTASPPPVAPQPQPTTSGPPLVTQTQMTQPQATQVPMVALPPPPFIPASPLTPSPSEIMTSVSPMITTEISSIATTITVPGVPMSASAMSTSTSVASIGPEQAQTDRQLAAAIGGILGGCVVIALITGIIIYLFIRRLRRREQRRREQTCNILRDNHFHPPDPEMASPQLPESRFSASDYFTPGAPVPAAALIRADSCRSYRSMSSTPPRNNSTTSRVSRNNSGASGIACLGVPSPEYREAEWAHLRGEQSSLRRQNSRARLRSPPPTIVEERDSYRASVYEMAVPSPRPVPQEQPQQTHERVISI